LRETRGSHTFPNFGGRPERGLSRPSLAAEA